MRVHVSYSYGNEMGVCEGSLASVCQSLLLLDQTNELMVVNKRDITNPDLVSNIEQQTPLGIPAWDDGERDDSLPPCQRAILPDGEESPLGMPTLEDDEEKELITNKDGQAGEEQAALGLPSWD